MESPSANMSQIVTATFDGSVFKPDIPVTLAGHTRVRLVIEPIDTDEKSKFLEELDDLCNEHPIYSTEPYLTRDQLHERS
jgi:predicted DNA-binding antitoxin AbrB/MazE fold protein